MMQNVVFPKSSFDFKFGTNYPNRCYYYIDYYNRDFHDLPAGRWEIIGTTKRHDGRVVVTFKKIK